MRYITIVLFIPNVVLPDTALSHVILLYVIAMNVLSMVLIVFSCYNVIRQERTGLEAQHRNKINAEINRYQAMVQEKEELSRKWDEEV